jgi:hypothetical protein
VAKFEPLVKQITGLTLQCARDIAKSDWRLLFVCVDILLLMEVGNAHEQLKAEVALLLAAPRPSAQRRIQMCVDQRGLAAPQHVHSSLLELLHLEGCSAALREHESLLQRLLGILFLWAMRTRHTQVRQCFHCVCCPPTHLPPDRESRGIQTEEVEELRQRIFAALPVVRRLVEAGSEGAEEPAEVDRTAATSKNILLGLGMPHPHGF